MRIDEKLEELKELIDELEFFTQEDIGYMTNRLRIVHEELTELIGEENDKE